MGLKCATGVGGVDYDLNVLGLLGGSAVMVEWDIIDAIHSHIKTLHLIVLRL